jgi:hypothetical protein
MVKDADEEVTTNEAASYLEVTPAHIRLLVYRGALKGEKRGRDLWVSIRSLADYKKNRRPPGRPEGAISTEPSKNKRGERERIYQREYKRRLRKGQQPGKKAKASRRLKAKYR